MRIISLAVLSAVAAAGATPGTVDGFLPARLEPVYRALDASFDERLALDTVFYMSKFWRIAGNPGFNASIDFIQQRLSEGGVATAVSEFQGEGHGWEAVRLGLPGDGTIAINSFSTDGEVALRLVDVGEGTSDADYTDRPIAGSVALTSSRLGGVWAKAVAERGAAGVISRFLPPYNESAGADVVSWERVPFDEQRRAFGIKVSPRFGATLAQMAREGNLLRVNVQTRFHELPTRTLVAEIPGHLRPDERIVMVAHVQEPGANDDASGCGTLLALARALAKGIRDGKIPRAQRTLTFLWVDENRGSEQWLNEDPERARNVKYMFSLDMTGEDTSKTGGTFLIEKQPDPSAVWERPSDPHTEWGASKVDAASLKGSLLNDLHLAVCQRRARDTGWVVRTNPYEGGSDHTVFGTAGIPALLDWHFTDRYYHTNLDTPDKVSPAEMKNVGVSVAATAWLLASANKDDARAVARLIEHAAAERIALERQQSADEAIVAAWRKWYDEALESVRALPVARR